MMPKRAKTMTIVVSGDYHGPQNRSTGSLSWEPSYTSFARHSFKIVPRLILSETGFGESDSFFLLNKRLGGEYEVSEHVTRAAEPGDSSSGAQEEGLREEA